MISWENGLVWINKHHDQILFSDLLTGEHKHVIYNGRKISDISIFHDSFYKQFINETSYCKELNCKHLCMRSNDGNFNCWCPNNLVLLNNRRCACPSGTKLNFLKQTCEEITCFSNYFKCKNGNCVPKTWVCDGDDECKDNSDEDKEVCGIKTCHDFQFRCDNEKCIPKNYLCDSLNDCGDSSDERNCTISCETNQHRCKNSSKCINHYAICDGLNDCPEGDDEENCGCSKDKFKCKTIQSCLDWHLVCNNNTDCLDNSDEGDFCKESCDNKGCTGDCKKTPEGPVCFCPKGKMLIDSTRCVDINECDLEENMCDHFCSNSPGSFHCTCADKFYLENSNICRSSDDGVLMYSVGKEIKATIITETTEYKENTMTIIKFQDDITCLAYDNKKDEVYFSTSKSIYKTSFLNVNSKEPIKFLDVRINSVKSLNIDAIARNIYIADSKNDIILLCNLDQINCIPLIRNIRVKTMTLDLNPSQKN